MYLNNDFEKLIKKLPFFLQDKLNKHISKEQLLEIVLDLGRRPEARFVEGPEYLSQKLISWQDLDYLTKRISKFSNDNRSGIERTLHRISCFRNRQFLINGFTCRIGRTIFGTISIIRDLLELNKSILILGKPGVGKTTIIREISRVLADEMEKRVIIIDTSNEIAGDNDIPHLGIGRARRMQVSKPEFQHKVMIEAVENHMPQVIVIDEIGTELEVLAARTIAEKGVQLIGTTHGNCLENVIKNPLLVDLIGGIQYVTLSDEEAKRRGTQKTILERKTYPTFDILIEINEVNLWTIYEELSISIDNVLSNQNVIRQNRIILEGTKMLIKSQLNLSSSSKEFHGATLLNKPKILNLNVWNSKNQLLELSLLNPNIGKLVIYSYSISQNFLLEAFRKMGLRIKLTNNLEHASLILGLKQKLKKNLKLKKLAKKKKIPIYSLNQLSIYQLTKFIKCIH